jgi:hypothetical protein
MIETKEGFIEDPIDLKLDLDKLEFEKVTGRKSLEVSDVYVHDLEIDSLHNYIVSDGGIVHNGGGWVS